MTPAGRRGSFSGNVSIFVEGGREQEEDDDELREQPLLDSVRSLVKKERELAGLQLEEKERERELWKNKFLQLQRKTRGLDDVTAAPQEAVPPTEESSWLVERPLERADGDWDDLQAASKSADDSCFRELRQRESLNLSGQGIAAKELDGAIVKVKWLRGITSVDLSKNKIDDECASALRNLMTIKHLRQVDLSGNEIGASAGVSVLESLVRCRDLQVLRLDGNMVLARAVGMGARVTSCLLAARKVGACRHLWSLSLTADDFDNGILDVHRAPSRRKSIASPRSSEVEIKGREGSVSGPGSSASRPRRRAPPAPSRTVPVHPMNALAVVRSFHPRAGTSGGVGAVLDRERTTRIVDHQGGEGHEGITSLGLPYARLHPRTVDEIATRAIASLTRLDLAFCYVGSAGAKVLACALGEGGKGSCSLRHLRLPHNAIGDAGAIAFARALEKNHRLASLDLASNGIRSAGGSALASIFRGNFIALLRLDVGDNPLGTQSSQMLVSGAAAALDRASVAIEILGLDRVAGASVATKEVARRTAAFRQRLQPRDGGGVEAERGLESPLIPEERFSLDRASSSVISVTEEVQVNPGVPTGRDGFVQAYALKLDSRFKSPSDRIARSWDGVGPITLEIRWWWFAVAGSREGRGTPSTPVDTNFSSRYYISWRVSRARDEVDSCLVKEGIAERRALLAAPSADGDIHGYSPIRIVCNGWRIGDLVKISVRPARGTQSSSCRDLIIRLLEANAADSYGLLWADREQGDALPTPSTAERASVAFQMHQPPPEQWTGTNNSTVDNTYRLRKVLIPSGGRIRATWKAMVLDKASQRFNAKGPEGGGQIGGNGCRPPCRYAWAIVRTRGAVDDADEAGAGGADSVAMIDPSSSSLYMMPSARVVSRGHASSPSPYDHSNPSPRWRWQCFEVDSTGWLPGDLLSLWIRVYPDHHHSGTTQDSSRSATAAWGVGEDSTASGRAEDTSDRCNSRYAPSGHSIGEMTSRNGGRLEEEGAWEPPFTPQQTRFCYPFVRGFELRRMDDAREDAITDRTRPRSRRSLRLRYARMQASGGTVPRQSSDNLKVVSENEGNPFVPVGTGDRGGLMGNNEEPGRLSFPPASSLPPAHREARPGDGFCLMNMAAAGGSWA